MRGKLGPIKASGTQSRTLSRGGGRWPDYSPAWWSHGPEGSQTESAPSGTPTPTGSELTQRSSEAVPDDETRSPPLELSATWPMPRWRGRPSDSDEKRRLLRHYVDPRSSTTWADLEPTILAAPVAAEPFPLLRTVLILAFLVVALCLPLRCNGVRLANDERVAQTGLGVGW